jgi:succinate dehydrogenase (ubiquinone) cytochrome b560 subunit
VTVLPLCMKQAANALSLPPTYSPVATAKLNPAEGQEILVKQRLNRPVSPNLGIYKIDQVWLSDSAWTRITGCALSGASYAFFSAYLVAPLLGWHLESASVAAFFADLPFAVQSGVKFALSYPFTYHFINGIRHLVNDLGAGYTKSSLDTTKYIVWGSAAAAALGLTFAL